MKARGLLKAGAVMRVGIIGPGLDFTDKQEGFDFYPIQTVQPFAVMDSLLRLSLATPGEVSRSGHAGFEPAHLADAPVRYFAEAHCSTQEKHTALFLFGLLDSPGTSTSLSSDP